MKRIQIDLSGDGCPAGVGKSSEAFSEVVNICATVERMLDSLRWFESSQRLFRVDQCHPSTSDEEAGNDLVLSAFGEVKVICEITDVAADNPAASHNGKERQDLRRLGCFGAVPLDQKERYIVTSAAFGQALASAKRNWNASFYRYKSMDLASGTRLLQIMPRGGEPPSIISQP